MHEIETKKIIFISENHDEVRPIYFMIENLEKFYKAGVRYLFLEEETDNYIENPDKLNIWIFPPWQQQGTKFQYLLFEEEILKLNQKYPDDPIVTIWPETGAVFEDGDWDDTHKWMSKRDLQGQKTIIETMDRTDKKAIVFYGSGHGIKEPFVWDSESSKEPFWTPCGYYLNNHYGTDYCSFVLFNFQTNVYHKVIYDNNDDVKIIPENTMYTLLKEDGDEYNFDYYAGYEKWIPAVPVSYVPDYYVLKSMITKLQSKKIEAESKIDPWSDKSDLMFAVYFLKYHLGDKFNFDLTMSQSELKKCLLALSDDDIKTQPYNIKELEEYMTYLYSASYGSSIKNIEFCMNNAKKLNSKDIWPQFHLCRMKQLKADESGKVKDYKKALEAWEELFKNRLLYSSMVLDFACQKAVLCADKIKDQTKSDYYKNIKSKINPDYKIEYENYGYFGW